MKRKIIDLSFPLEDGMITYPTSSHHRFESSILGRIEIEGRETRKFTMGSHCGTHVDAMRHFHKDGLTVDKLSLDALVGEALLINLGTLEPGAIIQLSDIKDYFNTPCKRVVLRTDWSRFWNTKQYYQDWPYLTKEAAEFLTQQNIELLAIDFPSPDSAYFGNDCSLDCPNHKIFFSHNIILTEYLTNLAALPVGRIFIMVSPLKLIDFDGSPARVTAYSLEVE